MDDVVVNEQCIDTILSSDDDNDNGVIEDDTIICTTAAGGENSESLISDGDEGEGCHRSTLPAIDFVSALKDKYSDDSSELTFVIHVARPRRTSQNDQDTANSDKFTIPSIVSLNRGCINTIGNLSKVTSQANFLTELDLAENQISDWNDVFALLITFPQLQFLNLSFNPLHTICDHYDKLNSVKCDKLQRLILNQTGVQFKMVELLLSACSCLSELHLSLNQYTSIHFSDEFVNTTISIFYFNNNDIDNWNELDKLGQNFPKLEILSLAETSCSTINEKTAKSFTNLKCLNLSKTTLNSWDNLEKLNSFPLLEEIRLMHIPLIQNLNEKLCRQLLLSHLPNIKRLNASHVTDKERDEAERATIRYHMNRDTKPTRYDVLVSKHGELDALVDVNLCPKTQCTVRLKHGDKQTLMNVDTKWTVKIMKKKVSDWCGLPLNRFTLFYENLEILHGAIALKLADKQLYTFNCEDGFNFIVQEIPGLQVKVTFDDKVTHIPVNKKWTIDRLKKSVSEWCEIPVKHFRLTFIDLEKSSIEMPLKLASQELMTLGLNDSVEFRVRRLEN